MKHKQIFVSYDADLPYQIQHLCQITVDEPILSAGIREAYFAIEFDMNYKTYTIIKDYWFGRNLEQTFKSLDDLFFWHKSQRIIQQTIKDLQQQTTAT